MLRKNSSLIATLCITLSLGISSSALALTTPKSDENKNPNNKIEGSKDCKDRKDCKGKNGEHKHKGFIHPDTMEKLGITKDDMRLAKESGKSIFDIIKEKKGLSPKEAKNIIIEDKTNRINKKVEEGKMPKEKADEIIMNMKSRIEKWDGTFPDSKSHRKE
ncbi:hypothetical protein GCM10008905_07690 [Clostridium malenominatum]|uniref:Uncharacterized protein n=1 Tax=Clostridium malenominatum TaxID=1539 RepID=A0ABN1IRX2_9CLOT